MKYWTYRADFKVSALLRTRSESEFPGSITVRVEGGTNLSTNINLAEEMGLRVVVGVTVTSGSGHRDGTHVRPVGRVNDSN